MTSPSPRQEQASFLQLLCMTDDDHAAAASASFLTSCRSPAAAVRNPQSAARIRCNDTVTRKRYAPEGGTTPLRSQSHGAAHHHSAAAAHADITTTTGDHRLLQSPDHDLFYQRHHKPAPDQYYFDKSCNNISQVQGAEHGGADSRQHLLQEDDQCHNLAAYEEGFNFEHFDTSLINSDIAADHDDPSTATASPNLGSHPLPFLHVAPDLAATSESSQNERTHDNSDLELPSASKDETSIDYKPASKKVKKVAQPCVALQTRSETDILDDGFRWRKYGQKAVKHNTHPRSYYRCTYSNCNVKKRVERCLQDPGIVVTTYQGIHNHHCVQQPPQQPFELPASSYAPHHYLPDSRRMNAAPSFLSFPSRMNPPNFAISPFLHGDSLS